ncbi:helix-turn-helix transcriptional regulator [Candidatus Sumerlaeota bacterium]|nr:helix-turn-helix transcriptional regulator [Candidatus Sumerlaeota bacterium]
MGLTVTQMADRLGIPRKTLARWETANGPDEPCARHGC